MVKRISAKRHDCVVTYISGSKKKKKIPSVFLKLAWKCAGTERVRSENSNHQDVTLSVGMESALGGTNLNLFTELC